MGGSAEAVPVTAKIIVIRHGEKTDEKDDKSKLTPRGHDQVEDAVTKTFGGQVEQLGLGMAYASELPRAIQTAELAAQRLRDFGAPMPTVDSRVNLGYSGLTTDGYKELQAKKAHGARLTIGDVALHRPRYYREARERLGDELRGIAYELASNDIRAAVVGSHSPLAEILLNERSIPLFGFAGIVQYSYQVDVLAGTILLLEGTVLFEGYPEN